VLVKLNKSQALGYSSPKEDVVARGQKDQNLSLNKIKVEVELDNLYWKNSQDYKHW
jgi:hypothetical protein